MPHPSKRFGMAASKADHFVVRLLGAATVAEIFDNSSAESSPRSSPAGVDPSPHSGVACSGRGPISQPFVPSDGAWLGPSDADAAWQAAYSGNGEALWQAGAHARRMGAASLHGIRRSRAIPRQSSRQPLLLPSQVATDSSSRAEPLSLPSSAPSRAASKGARSRRERKQRRSAAPGVAPERPACAEHRGQVGWTRDRSHWRAWGH